MGSHNSHNSNPTKNWGHPKFMITDNMVPAETGVSRKKPVMSSRLAKRHQALSSSEPDEYGLS